MSGDVNRGRMESPRDRLHNLQSRAEAVQNMVKQMKGTEMAYDRDMTDTFERPPSLNDKGRQQQNSRSWNDPVQSPRARGYQRGRSQRSRNKRGNRGGKARGYSPKETDLYEDCLHSLPFDQMSQTSDSGSERSYERGGHRGHKEFTHRQNSADRKKPSLQSLDPTGIEPSPSQLVLALSEFPGFRASLLQLMENKGMKPTHVRSTVSNHANTFQLSSEMVELVPKIALCSEHAGENGCLNQVSCKELHLCPIYVSSWCNNTNCVYGHRWFTNHNKRVLCSYSLEELSGQNLYKLFQSLKVAGEQQGPVDICKNYNGNGCGKSNCDALHVCLSFVAGRTKCSRSQCQLNHDILAPECCLILSQHGFSTNETPRDVVVALLSANPSLDTPKTSQNEDQKTNNEQKLEKKEFVNEQSGTDNQKTVPLKDEVQQKRVKKSKVQKSAEKRGEELKQENIQNLSASDVYSDEFVLSDSSSDTSDSKEVILKKKTGSKSSKQNASKANLTKTNGDDNVLRKAKPSKTAWSHDYEGDTEIAEICYYSVESSCRNEKNVCPRLHSALHYHWQISEQGDSWLNLTDHQIKSLEVAFCDPSQDGVILPRLDPAKLSSSQKDFFKVMGRDTWQANFEAMILTNTDYSRVLILRRLCTQNVPGKTDNLTRHNWFFLDKNKKWVKYGNVDTAGEAKLVSSVTSDDIENHFLQTPHTPLNFQNESYKYTIDFNRMSQKNQNTKVVRCVRRRPVPQAMKDAQQVTNAPSGSKEDGGLPATWDPMQPQERMRLVQLNTGSAEYQSVNNFLQGVGGNSLPSVLNGLGGGNSFPTVPNTLGASAPMPSPFLLQQVNLGRHQNNSTVLKIERIQNPFLWNAFQNKVKEMTAVYGDISKVDIRHLFHGTSSSVVNSICVENFDWRLHGTSSGQSYGKGTYFSPNFSTSLGYCRPDPSGLRNIFVARVAVGSIYTSGNSSTARPPINQATGSPFDSTGDGVNVIVKYDKQEYYPEYLITMR